jgi:monofunctional biosynthetic peptidoglycan transglycosylase
MARAVLAGALGGLVFASLAALLVLLPLRWLPPPTSAFMLQSRFADPASGRPCERVEQRWVALEQISRHLAFAVVVAEDQRFFQHRGFDFHAIGDALEEGVETGRLRGASTLTQQLAKTLFLWPGRSALRKGLEVWPTLWLELLWPKRRILEAYLNLAQFGPCVFGAEAASRRYFALPAAELDAEQAALLAAVLPNPAKLRAHDPGPWVQERSAEILGLMERLGGLAALARLPR